MTQLTTLLVRVDTAHEGTPHGNSLCKCSHAQSQQCHITESTLQQFVVQLWFGRPTTEQYLVVVQEGLALHELVILAEAVIEEVADTGVVGQHEPAHSVR